MNEGITPKIVNDEVKKNEEMLKMVKHVSATCEGAYGYLKEVVDWLDRSAQWKYCCEGDYECTCCKALVCVEEDFQYMPKYRYCPYCGAVMKGN